MHVTGNLIHGNDYGMVNVATNQCQEGGPAGALRATGPV